MEETPEGLALAAAAREAIKERKRALEDGVRLDAFIPRLFNKHAH